MTQTEPVHAPLAAPTYLTHITVPVFRRGRAVGVALAAHAAAVLIVLLVLHHRFAANKPDEAMVALVIEQSPYVGAGPTVVTPNTKPAPKRAQTREAVPQALRAQPAAIATPSKAAAEALAANTGPLPPPPPPAPAAAPAVAPALQPVAAPHPAPAPAPHLGSNQPRGYGLVIDAKVIPARPDARINLPPAYPPEALTHGEQGRVLLSIEVAPNGRASAVIIVASSGYIILDNAARETILGWRFVPADIRGKPVWSTLLLPVRFQIDPSNANVP